jgi:hypothetical protein
LFVVFPKSKIITWRLALLLSHAFPRAAFPFLRRIHAANLSVSALNDAANCGGGFMTLSDFIEANLEGLIDDWTKFARELSPKGSHFTEEQLSDAARELLTAIAADMRHPQNASQQQEKSHGSRPDPDSAFNQLGRGHADDRQSHGFEINALIGEYRALRASVLKRWQATCQLDSSALQEMIRFNEAIDQMVAESVR